MEKITCFQAKQIDLVAYLADLGHYPQKINGADHWYLSPLRDEQTPSFKVNREKNIWYDHGSGMGGTIIDFGTRYFNCTIIGLLQRMAHTPHFFSFHPPTTHPLNAVEKKNTTGNRIVITGTCHLSDPALWNYLEQRHIPVHIASRYCRQVHFLLYGKTYRAIGFQNNAGGYELRGPEFKGSSSPKAITLINNRSSELAVFEGFFSFLSLCTFNHKKHSSLTNCLILNSLAFLKKSRAIMEQHSRVCLMLDRDKAGIAATQMATRWNPNLYIDWSNLYSGHKDLNEWLIQKEQNVKQRQSIRPSF